MLTSTNIHQIASNLRCHDDHVTSLLFIFHADVGHAVQEETSAPQQPHPAPDIFSGGHRRQRPWEHRHPQQSSLWRPSLWPWGTTFIISKRVILNMLSLIDPCHAKFIEERFEFHIISQNWDELYDNAVVPFLQVWHEAPGDLQRSLYEHFFELLTESR